MRWDALFADLEAQAAADEAADLDAEVAERVRIEAGRITLGDRLRGQSGSPVALRLRSGAGDGGVRGTVLGVGSDVVLLADDSGRHVVVPFHALSSMSGLGRAAVAEPSKVRAGLGLREVLRGIARERRSVRVLAAGGEVSGLIRRVAADHMDVDRSLEGRIEGRVDGAVETVVLAAVLAVWSG